MCVRGADRQKQGITPDVSSPHTVWNKFLLNILIPRHTINSFCQIHAILPADTSEDFESVKSTVLSLASLQVATDNFHESNKIGEGGFGAVYKVWHEYS